MTGSEAELALARAGAYGFFSDLLASWPGLENLERAFSEVEGVLGALGAGAALLSRIRTALAEADPASAATEYGKLFGTGGPARVPLYESALTSREGLLMRPCVDEVVAAYAAEGVRPTARHEPPDHLAFELAFLGLLCDREADATTSCDAVRTDELRGAQRGFLHRHVLPAVAVLAARVSEAGSEPLVALVEALHRFAALDARLLAAADTVPA